MPRKARIDAPGALQHIIGRGIERRNIFLDNSDKDNFVARLGRIISDTETPCYAWALLDNHFHLLLKTGNVPIATLMRRLLTGYVVSFNLRHDRVGTLFQNRYKSILCQEDPYFLELVRYIHLNPLRAGLVGSMQQLDRYLYCGHHIVMGKRKNDWQDTQYLLSLFDHNTTNARREYRDFVSKGIKMGRRPDLIGGGMVRSAGGWTKLKSIRKQAMHIKGDERILGDSDFVTSVLDEQNERLERQYRLEAAGVDFDSLLLLVARIFKLNPQELLKPSRQHERLSARCLLCYWAVSELKMNGVEIGRRINLSKSSVSRAVIRGERIAAERKLKLDMK
jgi:REP element-mobilizing transposase RayT